MISEILQKLGLQSIDDLTPAEKATYEAWSKILSKPDVTIDDLKAILPKELERANVELRSFDNSEKKDNYYKAYTQLLTRLTTIIVGPTNAREELKTHLQKKFNL
jgi:hypothetical protein